MFRYLAAVLAMGLMLIAVPQKSTAQKVGVGVIYGSKLKTVGGKIDATYRFHQYFRINGEVALFLPRDYQQSNDQWNWWSININGNFVFVETGRFRSYVLAGLNYATIRVEEAVTGGQFVDSDLGLNTGGGLEYSFDFGDVFFEAKYVFIGERYQQTAANAGVRFYLGGY